MSTFAAPIVEFTLEKHPNADSLSIANIKGWQCIVRTEDFENERLGVYVPLDAVAGKDHPLLSFMDGKKVKTIRVRGVISQGILLPYSKVIAHIKKKHKVADLQVGDDLHVPLELKKWEPPKKPQRLGGNLFADSYLDAPDWMTKYTDIENWNNHTDVIQVGEPVTITEKLHGTSVRYALVDGQFYIGSRNRVLRTKPYISKKSLHYWKKQSLLKRFWLRCKGKGPKKVNPTDTVWHKIAKMYNIEKALRTLSTELTSEGGNIALYGEIVGPGVQDLEYGLEDIEFFAYDLRVDETCSKLPQSPNGYEYVKASTFRTIMKNLDIPTVPVLKVGPFDPKDLELRLGRDTINKAHTREGIVIETSEPRWDPKLGRVILKRVSEEYLLRKGGTDY
jgi:RNA ligase (TIGR02306 family)